MNFWENTLIFIPAYNVADFLATTVNGLPTHVRTQVREILIVDNASSDETYAAAQDLMRHHPNLRVIRNAKNEGYGGSQKIAYRHALDANFKHVVMLHGDGQYAPAMIEHLIEPLVHGHADAVLGSRILGNPRAGGMPWLRYVGNRALTFTQNRLLGANLSEFHSGYRVYSTEALRATGFERFSSDYHFDTEIIIAFLHKKQRIVEVPIPTHYGNEVSHLNVWSYGTRVLLSTVGYVLQSRRWRNIINGESS